MCGGGGGGGGDGGAQARADENARRIAQATNQINAIFGVPSFQTDVPGAGSVVPTIPVTRSEQVTDPWSGQSDSSGGIPSIITRNVTEQVPDPNYLKTLQDTAAANKAAIDKTYGTTRDDILNYFKNQLNEQRDVANRNVSQQLAQAGLTGGSAQTDVNADLSRTYNDALLGYTNTADTSVNNLKSSDEQARLNLISQITSGMDSASAAAAASAALKNNADLAASSATQAGVGNIFGNFGNLYNASQVGAGQNQAYNRVMSALGMLNPGSYSGTVTG